MANLIQLFPETNHEITKKNDASKMNSFSQKIENLEKEINQYKKDKRYQVIFNIVFSIVVVVSFFTFMIFKS